MMNHVKSNYHLHYMLIIKIKWRNELDHEKKNKKLVSFKDKNWKKNIYVFFCFLFILGSNPWVVTKKK